jgi:A/G-specific adenine glycosylase
VPEKAAAVCRQLAQRLVVWYARHGRDLPWRRTRDPYAIWVSEVMLQQTRVETVIPYYRRFLSRFPSVESLARASLDDVLKLWENLGYYARARNLHEAARRIVAQYGGRLPRDPAGIRGLPGVGPYMEGAIRSLAFGEPVPAVDGNVRRVVARLFAVGDPIDAPATRRALEELARSLVPPTCPGCFNQAVMDLGAMICTPGKPSCDACPLDGLCKARRQGLQDALPVRSGRRPLPCFLWTAGAIPDGSGRLLVVQRPRAGLLGGLWKLPGGKSEPGEALRQCLRRTVREEVGILVRVGEPIASVHHAFTHFRVTLHAFHAAPGKGAPRALGCARWRWVAPGELAELAFSKVDRLVLQAVGG